MISVAEARAHLVALATKQPVEMVPLRQAAGRVLAGDVTAPHPQPPFAASAMDGYAIASPPELGTRLQVIGEAAAGHPFEGTVLPGQAVRIFTGAPVPEGTERILIQENATRDGSVITITEPVGAGTHIRAKGADYDSGFGLPQGRLRPVDIALAASMGLGELPVRKAPEVAVLMTGDELTTPGNHLANGQIYASNGYAISAILEAEGAQCRLLPLTADTPELLRSSLSLAEDTDLVITIGGASVGDHDLVASVASDAGLDLAFHKIRMRPGKPLLAGRFGAGLLVGLPGNPVSSIVCTQIFVLPLIRAMIGLPTEPLVRQAKLATTVPQNGPREHYMRAVLNGGGLHVFEKQDSSLLSVLSQANALVIRQPDEGPGDVGDIVDYTPI